MVEVKNIKINQHHFIGIYLNLPQYPIHFIISTHAILAQNNFSLDYFEQQDKHVAVIICEYSFGFDGLLDSVVTQMNTIALEKGVIQGMKAKEALLLCEESKIKEV